VVGKQDGLPTTTYERATVQCMRRRRRQMSLNGSAASAAFRRQRILRARAIVSTDSSTVACV